MPIVTIQSPSGQSFQIEAPDGATDDQILRFAKSQGLFDSKPQQAPQPEQSAAPQSSPESGPIDSLIGGLEGAASMASSMIAEPVAGLTGIVAAANPFGESGDGAKTIESVRDMLTYQPKTERGKAGIGKLSELMQPVGEAIEKVRDSVGDDAFAVTGSPLVASMFSALPDATLAMMGLGKGGKIKNAVKAREEIGKMIASGDRSAATIAKALDSDGKLITNPNLKKAIKLMGDGEGAYSAAINFEKMNKATKRQVNRMLNTIESNYKSGDNALTMTNRPANVVGDSLAIRVEKLDSIRKAASKRVGQIVDGADGSKQIPTSAALDEFMSKLKQSDVDFMSDDAGKTIADSSRSITNVGEVVGDKKINNIIRKLEGGSISVNQAHKLKRQLRELVDFDPKAPGTAKVSDEVGDAVKGLAQKLNDESGMAVPAYKKANGVISDSMDALKEADRLLGKRLMIGDELASSKLGSMAKRIGTNLASKEEVIAFLDTVDGALAKRGIKFKDDVTRQVATLSDLEKIFKVESAQAPFGFMSRIEQGATNAIQGQGLVSQGIDMALDKFRSMSELEFEQKMKALRALTKAD